MNRLSVRLLGAFSIVLVLTLAIMWLALLVVLRSQPPNTDTQALSLAAVVIDASQLATERTLAERDAIRQQDPNRDIDEGLSSLSGNILRETLQEQATATNSRLMIMRGTSCILWDSASTNENGLRLLEKPLSGELLLGTQQRRSSNIVSGQFIDNDDSLWLYSALPIANLNSLLPNRQRLLRGAITICGAITGRQAPFYIVAAEPYPQPSIRSVLATYRDDGLFLALIQAVIIGIFFALVASYTIVRWVARPLNDLADTTRAIANGDFSRRVPLRGPNEVQMVANTFNQMANQVATSRQAQQDFFANVSHDLRTPLTSIQGFAQAIVEGVTEGEAAKHSASVIQSEADRMVRMVNDLLVLAKIQAGRIEMSKHTIDIEAILTQVGQSLSMKAYQKGIQLQTQLQALPTLSGDGDRLAQVFTNLLDNAIKHTDAGGQIWLRAKRDQGGVLIEVEDTGEGIPPADLPRIFERFYQVDKSRAKLQGSGLGLAIAKEIITAHQGRMWVESTYQHSTHFWVWLPVLENDSSAIVNKRIY